MWIPQMEIVKYWSENREIVNSWSGSSEIVHSCSKWNSWISEVKILYSWSGTVNSKTGIQDFLNMKWWNDGFPVFRNSWINLRHLRLLFFETESWIAPKVTGRSPEFLNWKPSIPEFKMINYRNYLVFKKLIFKLRFHL